MFEGDQLGRRPMEDEVEKVIVMISPSDMANRQIRSRQAKAGCASKLLKNGIPLFIFLVLD